MKFAAISGRHLAVILVSMCAWSGAQAKDDGTDAATTIEKDAQAYVVNADGTYVVNTDVAILVNEERAIKTASERKLTYYRDRQTIEVVEAYTQKPDGRHLPVVADKIMDQQTGTSVNAPMFQDSRVKIVIFPDVAVGDRLVLRVRRTQFKSQIPGYFQDLTAPGFTPIKQLSITYDMPADVPLYSDNRGFTESHPQAAAGRKLYRWDYIPMENPRIEQDAIGWQEFRSRLLVGTFADFATLAKAYDDGAKDKSVVTPRIAELAQTITKKIADPRAQAYAVDNWVRRNIRHVAVNVGPGGVVPHEADVVLENRYGDSKDQAALMEALLAALHIDSTPALINASTLYSLPKIPSLDTLFRVITYIPSLDLYLDATASAIAPGFLPRYELDKPVLLTKSGTIAHTPKTQVEKLDSSSTYKIAADGTGDFVHTDRFIGVGADITRRNNRDTKQADRDNYVERILRGRGLKGQGSFTVGDVEGAGDEYVQKLAGHVEDMVELPGPSGFAAPSSFMFTVSNVVYGLAAEKERTQPFVCNDVDIKESARIELPSDVNLIATPKPMDLHDARFDYTAQYTREDHAVLVTRHLQTHGNGKVCSPADYTAMRPDIDQMVRDIQAQIIVQTL